MVPLTEFINPRLKLCACFQPCGFQSHFISRAKTTPTPLLNHLSLLSCPSAPHTAPQPGNLNECFGKVVYSLDWLTFPMLQTPPGTTHWWSVCSLGCTSSLGPWLCIWTESNSGLSYYLSIRAGRRKSLQRSTESVCVSPCHRLLNPAFGFT